MKLKIGAKIKALRRRDDVTQEKLAEALGVTAQAISKWESENGYPDMEYLTPIANFFGVTIDFLFDRDTAENQNKIDGYACRFDEMYRNWEPVEDRVRLMREALAEFPANEKLRIRLASALSERWFDWRKADDFDGYSRIDGKWRHDFNKYRAHDGWQEPVRIMEDLLSSSVDESIRVQCRELLPELYAAVGEKEKAVAIAEFCPDCKPCTLYRAFNGIYDDEARVYSQQLLLGALHDLRVHLPSQTKDIAAETQAIHKLMDLYAFVFEGSEPEFYNSVFYFLCIDDAALQIRQNHFGEAIAALGKAYGYAKAFDEYLDRLRRGGEVQYTSPFLDVTKDVSSDVYAGKTVPEFLEIVLKDENDVYYQNLHDDPRYAELIAQIERELYA